MQHSDDASEIDDESSPPGRAALWPTKKPPRSSTR